MIESRLDAIKHQRGRSCRRKPNPLFSAPMITCVYFGVPISAMQSPETRIDWAWPRNIAMFFCCEFGVKKKTVARFFIRDHSTVYCAVKRVLARCSVDPQAADDVKFLRAEIKKDLGL